MVINNGINISAKDSIPGPDNTAENQGASNYRVVNKKGVNNKNDVPSAGVKQGELKAQGYNIGVHLEVESSLHIVLAKLIDKDSGEVIRQIPPAEIIRISKALKEQAEKGESSQLPDHRIDRKV